MKIKLFFSVFLMSILSFNAFSQTENIKNDKQETLVAERTSAVSWISKSYDFGNINKNNEADADFIFTNTSKQPIAIVKVKSSCGCTVTGYDKALVQPGQESVITATYDAKKQGPFRKTITVFLSDYSQHKLIIKGKVVSKTTVSMN